MGNAKWTGVPLRELLDAAKIKPGALAVQFQGLEKGKGPEGHGSHEFLKSLDLKNPVLDDSIVAYAMNDQPLPMLNGFPGAPDRSRLFRHVLDEGSQLDPRAG